MAKPKQLLEAGEAIKHNGNEFEVVHVMVLTDNNDNITAYIYEIITKEEADANRAAAEASAAEEQKRLNEAANNAANNA